MKNATTLIILALLLSCCNGVEEDTSKDIHETIVIGGGLMGSSTAWHLSKTGGSVLLLEKQDSLYTQGSSLGEARIARSSNRGNDIWSYLHNRSVAEAQELIQYLQANDPDQEYDISDIYTTSPVTYVGRLSIYDKLLASLIRQEVDYEMASTPEEGLSKFNVVLPDSVLIQREYNELSGIINPQQLIRHLHRATILAGNTIKYNTLVIGLQYDAEQDLYEVRTKNEQSGQTTTLFAKNIISAAGPYTGKLLQDVAPYFDAIINPQRVFLAFLKIKKERYESLTQAERDKLQSFYPVINSSKGTRTGSFFSMIEYYDEDNIPVIKIGGHFQRSDIDDLDTVWSKDLAESEVDWCMDGTAGYFELLQLPIARKDIELYDTYSCVYSLTETEVPFVTPIVNADRSPNNRFIVLGGMSGVGAKGAMTYGLVAADLMNQRSQSDSMYMVVRAALGFERLKEVSGY